MNLLHHSYNNSKLYIIICSGFSLFHPFFLFTFYHKILTSPPFIVFHSCVSQILASVPFLPYYTQKVEDFWQDRLQNANHKTVLNSPAIQVKIFFPHLNWEDFSSTLFCPIMSLDVSRLGIFCTIYHSHCKWHTFHNRKFLKHYKLRKNIKTISLYFHKEAVNSCSLKPIYSKPNELHSHCRTEVFLMENFL